MLSSCGPRMFQISVMAKLLETVFHELLKLFDLSGRVK